MSRRLLTALIALTAAAPLAAQSAPATLPPAGTVSITPFAGVAILVGDGADDLNSGPTVGAAADWRPAADSPFGFRLEGVYARFGAKGLSGTGVSAHVSDLGANLNGVVSITTTASTMTPYLTAGASYSHLTVSASGQGQNFSESENHWGFNVGGGLDVPFGTHAIRLDVRYKQISTSGSSYQSIPITFGFRF